MNMHENPPKNPLKAAADARSAELNNTGNTETNTADKAMLKEDILRGIEKAGKDLLAAQKAEANSKKNGVEITQKEFENQKNIKQQIENLEQQAKTISIQLDNTKLNKGEKLLSPGDAVDYNTYHNYEGEFNKELEKKFGNNKSDAEAKKLEHGAASTFEKEIKKMKEDDVLEKSFEESHAQDLNKDMANHGNSPEDMKKAFNEVEENVASALAADEKEDADLSKSFEGAFAEALTSDKITQLAVARNEMKTVQREYDAAAKMHYAKRGVGMQLFDSVWTSVGSKTPVALMRLSKKLEQKKNARREIAAGFRTRNPAEVLRFMREYDRYTDDEQKYKNYNHKEGEEMKFSVADAKQMNRNWWNRQPQETKELVTIGAVGTGVLAGTVVSGGATLVALPAGLLVGGIMKWVGKSSNKDTKELLDQQETTAASQETITAAEANELLTNAKKTMDSEELMANRATMGMGILAAMVGGSQSDIVLNKLAGTGSGLMSGMKAWLGGLDITYSSTGSELVPESVISGEVEQLNAAVKPLGEVQGPMPENVNKVVHQAASPVVESAQHPQGEYNYKIKEGDTIWDLVKSRTNGLSNQELVDIVAMVKESADSFGHNGSDVTNPDYIRTGETLNLQGIIDAAQENNIISAEQNPLANTSNVESQSASLNTNESNAASQLNPENVGEQNLDSNELNNSTTDTSREQLVQQSETANTAPIDKSGFIPGIKDNYTLTDIGRVIEHTKKVVPYEQIKTQLMGGLDNPEELVKRITEMKDYAKVENIYFSGADSQNGKTLWRFSTGTDVGNSLNVVLDIETGKSIPEMTVDSRPWYKKWFS